MDNHTKIRLLVCDVDGTLTNGEYIVSDNGAISKAFCTRDFYGLQKLQEAGVEVIIMTSSEDDVIMYKYRQLPNACVQKMSLTTGVLDKASELEKEINGTIGFKEIAYIGDDDNDVEAMSLCGITAAPADSHLAGTDHVNFTCSRDGGRGAVREFAEYILEHNRMRQEEKQENVNSSNR